MSPKDTQALRVVAVIPARYGSTRFPGKPLAEIHGKPMIQWVYERASEAKHVHSVLVATDDQRIFDAVESFGGKVVMTDSSLPSGTDRVAATAAVSPADIYVNVQGDEPMIRGDIIDAAVELVSSGRFRMGTLMTPLRSEEDLKSLTVVKVITDRGGKALYFSRFPIPYSRENPPAPAGYAPKRHIGLYVYDHDTLMKLSSLAPTALERGESLEQLRALENGIEIGVAEVEYETIGVDTPEDLEKVKTALVSK